MCPPDENSNSRESECDQSSYVHVSTTISCIVCLEPSVL